MSRPAIRSLSVLVVWTLPATGIAAGADLRAKFIKDQELYYVNATDMDMTERVPSGEAPAQEMKSVLKSESGMRVKVNEVKPDGSTELEWTILYFTMTATGGPMPIDYDSRDAVKKASPMAIMFQPMLNKPAIVSVNAKGEVTDYKGTDPATLGPMGQMVAHFFSKEAFQQIGLLPTFGAPQPAEPGATWTHHLELALPMNMGTMIHDSTFKLKKVDAAAKKAEIESQGKSSMKETASAGGADPDAASMLKIEKGDSQGTIQWDLETGQMESTQTQADMAMTIHMAGVTKNTTQKVKSSVKRAKLVDFKLQDEKAPSTQPATGAP